MSTDSTAPDTIVLIHGLWMTPRCWEAWIPYYENKGYRVLAPAYPGFEVEVEALRADDSVIAECSFTGTVAHLEGVVSGLDRPPIIMGHSFGGTLTQLLLDRGHGAAGVAIDSAPTEGVHVNPLSQIKSLFPALKNPANRHRSVAFTPKEFHYAFTNTLSEEASLAVYERYAIGAPGNWVWAYGLLANITPGHQDTWVNYKNDDRAPLLFIGGSEDHIMPPSVNKSNAKHYKSNTSTEYKEYAGRDHWTCAADGWEEVADDALEWAVAHAGQGAPATA
jgi:pimeloyl-ACP methyl ester carboxylesterase